MLLPKPALLGMLLTATATAQEIAKPPAVEGRWPGFRGDGSSLTKAADLPTRWSDDQNIAWRTRIPGVGQCSPVVWDGQVYVTSVEGPDKDKFHLLCLSETDGKVVWKQTVPAARRVKLTNMVSQASGTPVAGPHGVVALFDNGEVVACSHQGERLWQRNLSEEFGPMLNNHGLGTSPVLADGRLLVAVAHGERSYLLAVDSISGKTVWKTDHALPSGWSTPAIWRQGDTKQVIVSTSGVVQSFNFETGKPLWSIDGLKGNTVPSPTVAGDFVYIGASEMGEQLSLRVARDGKPLAQPEVVWRTTEAACSFGSPLLLNDRLYFTNKVGIAQCLDARTGKVLWKHRLPASCWASPLGAGDKVYFFGTGGVTTVMKAGDTAEVLAESTLKVEGRVFGVAAVSKGFALRTADEVIWIQGGR